MVQENVFYYPWSIRYLQRPSVFREGGMALWHRWLALGDETIEFATNAAREFGNTLEYACPLTPGADSRLNSVLLSKLFDEKSIYWYVINNQEFSNEANNVDFVIQLAKKIGISDFHILQHKDFLDDGAIQQILSVCGKTRNWDKKAWAYSNEIGKRALINGQIIDQIGKASMAKGWSGFLAHWPIIRIFCGSTSATKSS